jgi:hypothetical protein
MSEKAIVAIASVVITAIATITGAYITAIAPLKKENNILEQRLTDPTSVARGLATGYFYNFLYHIDVQLKASGVLVRFDENENQIKFKPLPAPREYRFTKDQVEIILIVPGHLNKEAIELATAEVKANKAELIVPGYHRKFMIKYELKQSGTILVITDLVSPYIATRYIASGSLKISEGSDASRKFERETLDEFKKTIDDLIANAPAPLGIKKYSWRIVG